MTTETKIKEILVMPSYNDGNLQIDVSIKRVTTVLGDQGEALAECPPARNTFRLGSDEIAVLKPVIESLIGATI